MPCRIPPLTVIGTNGIFAFFPATDTSTLEPSAAW
jgi:hypothetical protein